MHNKTQYDQNKVLLVKRKQTLKLALASWNLTLGQIS